MSTTVRNSAGGYIASALWLMSFVGNVLAADLIGVVLRNNSPLQGESVILKYADKEAGKATTDRNGRFVIRNLRPGVYEMRCGKSAASARVRINDGLNEINCRG